MLRTGSYTQLSPVLFGSGTVAQAAEKAKAIGITKAMIVTDQGVVKTGHDKKLIKSLEQAGLAYVLWPNSIGDCPDSSVREGAAFAREQKVDGIIGFGGGSSLDTAKAIAVIAANTDAILDEIPAYLSGQKQYPNAPMPKLLIPTTFGTGAECTFVCVITDSKLDCKIGLPSPPTFAIVDPELALGMPAFVTAFTGMDAFSHASEALAEVKNTYHSDVMAYEAIRIITQWLPKACADINDLEAREWMGIASNFAGISFSESGVHIGHSIAHALGHKYHLAHGICCALVTPPTIEFTAKAYPEKIAKLGEAMGLAVTEKDPKKIGKQVADAVRNLMKEIAIPSFEAQGLTKDQIMAVVDLVYGEPLCTCFCGEITKEDVITTVASCYDGYK